MSEAHDVGEVRSAVDGRVLHITVDRARFGRIDRQSPEVSKPGGGG